MCDCLDPCAETCADKIAALRAQVRCLTRQLESLTKQVAVLTERQREATELDHIIRRARFAPYVDTPQPHPPDQPRQRLHLVET